MPHSGGYPHSKFEGNLLLFKFEPHTKSGLTIPQCARPCRGRALLPHPRLQRLRLWQGGARATLVSLTGDRWVAGHFLITGLKVAQVRELHTRTSPGALITLHRYLKLAELLIINKGCVDVLTRQEMPNVEVWISRHPSINCLVFDSCAAASQACMHQIKGQWPYRPAATWGIIIDHVTS